MLWKMWLKYGIVNDNVFINDIIKTFVIFQIQSLLQQLHRFLHLKYLKIEDISKNTYLKGKVGDE